MKVLAVETATRVQSVALLDGEQVMAVSEMEAGGAQARWLIDAIDRVLMANDLSLARLDGLAISIGPGSFTGLRVGLATVLGFRAVTGLAVAAVPTLEAMAWSLRHVTQPLCPILKARTREAYWARYRWTEGGQLERLAEERVGTPEQIAASIETPTLVYGEGWQAFKDEIRECLGTRAGDACEAPPGAMAASAVGVGLAGCARLRRGDHAPAEVAPRYVQRSQAELDWERRQRSDSSRGSAVGR